MPIYSFRIVTNDGARGGQDLGFYNDDAAIGYARKLAYGAKVEVVRETATVAVVDEQGASRAAPAL
ncbi:MAG: hypothetical protein ACK4K7_02965 [Allosphingosinicella sp.]|uniref:hypothetical protein n=1 Tax=Allosphingosinicella sp. TaxID=2823234 RepID=UPI00393D11FE